MRFLAVILLAALLLQSCSTQPEQADPVKQAEQAESKNPYVGLESRPIKALSESEIDGLRTGQGMGFAMTAELNGLPGPRHVLELADRLELTPDQREGTERLFAAMNTEARSLGEALIEAERSIEEAFSDAGSVDTSAVKERLLEAAEVRGSLRWAHIRAHVAQTEILTEHQRRLYIELRGYESEHQHQGGSHRGRDSHEDHGNAG